MLVLEGHRTIQLQLLHYWSEHTHFSNNTGDSSTHGPPQMVNTKIRLIILFAAEDEEDFYSQQKQDLVLTMAQFIHQLLVANQA